MKYTISDLQQMYRSYRMKALFLLLLLAAALVFVFQNHILTLAALALAVLFHLRQFRAYTLPKTQHPVCIRKKCGSHYSLAYAKGCAYAFSPNLVHTASSLGTVRPDKRTFRFPL